MGDDVSRLTGLLCKTEGPLVAEKSLAVALDFGMGPSRLPRLPRLLGFVTYASTSRDQLGSRIWTSMLQLLQHVEIEYWV